MKHPEKRQASYSRPTRETKQDRVSLVKLLDSHELDSHELDSRYQRIPLFTAIHHNREPEVILWDEYEHQGKHDS
ncbi:MAG: hypothetical protein V7677_17530 [Motiliproteus sp.]